MDSKDKYAKDLERNLESIVPEKDKYIESLKEAMDSKDKYAKDLERNLESIIPEKDKYIESLREHIDEKDKYIGNLLNAFDAKVKEIADLSASIAKKNEDIERLNLELSAVKNMVVYRLLKKFKFVKMSPTDLK